MGRSRERRHSSQRDHVPDFGSRRRILIDGRRAQGARTGVGHYTLSILRHWPDGVCHEVLASSRSEIPALTSGVLACWPGGPTWHLWAALRVFTRRTLYFSPESLIVPIIVGARAALTVHDLTPVTMPAVHTTRNIVIHKLLFALALRRVGTIIVPSNAVRQELVAFMPSTAAKVHVIHEGPRDTTMTTGLPLTQASEEHRYGRYMLYVGTVEPRKNVLTLIDAFRDAAPEDWRLLIVGKLGWLSPEESATFGRLCDSDRVIYLGYVEDAALPALYSNAEVFCYPSEIEGFGLPLLEAMQQGVPVVHSDAAALVEVAGNAGLSVRRARLAGDLRSAFRELCGDGAARQRLGEAGRLRAQAFSWDRAARATATIVGGLGNA
jgi:glycosyltransferase involved in cell wall biosynthesis